MDFRKHTPHRRENPSHINKASEAKKELREDFHQRCGYCDDHDYFRQTYYEVDHFVPKTILKSISDTAYSNLVYACRSCNNAKRNSWPTADENIHNDGISGFIDPCSDNYAKQFARTPDGSIIPITELGEWMWSTLRLYHPSHHIIRQLEHLKTNLKILIENTADNNPDANRQIREIAEMYMKYEEELRETPVF